MNNAPELHPFVFAFGLAIIAFLMASVGSWIIVFVMASQKRFRIPDPEQRQVAPWGLFDILLALFLVAFLQLTLIQTALRWKWIESPAPIAASTDPQPPVTQVSDESNQVGDDFESDMTPENRIKFSSLAQSMNLLVVPIVSVIIAIRCRISWGRLGWSLHSLGKDVALAIGVAVLFLPAIYILMALLSFGLEHEYKHPILEMVGDDPWLLGFAIWMAVGVAPITEEFLFRVLFQGYLESMSAGPVSLRELFFGRMDSPVLMTGGDRFSTTDTPSTPVLEVLTAPPVVDQTPIIGESPIDLPTRTESVVRGKMPWWPVWVSGTLFGLAHVGYGMSWVPLIFLGFLLGWLYRTTHRIWPSFLLHVMVNSIAMAGLAAKIFGGTE